MAAVPAAGALTVKIENTIFYSLIKSVETITCHSSRVCGCSTFSWGTGCENREHHFLLTNKECRDYHLPFLTLIGSLWNSGVELFDGERNSYGHRNIVPLYNQGHHFMELKTQCPCWQDIFHFGREKKSILK